jgi:hypothetical protein
MIELLRMAAGDYYPRRHFLYLLSRSGSYQADHDFDAPSSSKGVKPFTGPPHFLLPALRTIERPRRAAVPLGLAEPTVCVAAHFLEASREQSASLDVELRAAQSCRGSRSRQAGRGTRIDAAIYDWFTESLDAADLQLHRVRSFKRSREADFVSKIEDIVAPSRPAAMPLDYRNIPGGHGRNWTVHVSIVTRIRSD